MERIAWIDLAKGIAILLVVMGHVCQMRFPETSLYLSSIIYSFHMPLFLFLSGLFADKAVEAADSCMSGTYIVKKSKSLLIPFVMWMLLWVLIKRDSIKLFLDGGFIYWYLPTLFEFLVLFCLMRTVSRGAGRNWIFFVLVAVSIGVLYVIPANSLVGRLTRIGYSAYFYLFFVMGYFFKMLLVRYMNCASRITPPQCFAD